MRGRIHYSLISLLLIVAAFPALGQKKLQVKLPRPAILGEAMAGARVILGPVTGTCSEEFAGLLRQDLRAHDIPLLAQPEPGATAVVTISVDISTCQAMPSLLMPGGGGALMHISRTEGHFLATVHVKDARSGEELATQTLRADPSRQNESPGVQPEWPAPADVITIARLQAVGQTRHLYEPWIETEEVSFMDDKDCNLRAELDLFKAGDYTGLLEAAAANAPSCNGNPKTVAAAWYNLGTAYRLVQNYDRALAAFANTGKLHDSRMVTDAIAQCQANKTLDQSLGRLLVAWEKQAPKDTRTARPVRTGILFTNDLVIRLVQGNVADEDILKMIDSEPNRFTLGHDDRIKLKQAGVQDTIVAAMERNL